MQTVLLKHESNFTFHFTLSLCSRTTGQNNIQRIARCCCCCCCFALSSFLLFILGFYFFSGICCGLNLTFPVSVGNSLILLFNNIQHPLSDGHFDNGPHILSFFPVFWLYPILFVIGWFGGCRCIVKLNSMTFNRI